MKRTLTLLVLMVLAATLPAQEKLTLTAPIVKADIAEWSIAKFEVDVEDSEIFITVKADSGEYRIVRYPNATTDLAATTTLINGLNTANLSTKSLRRRILERLQADGHLGAGTFSGGN